MATDEFRGKLTCETTTAIISVIMFITTLTHTHNFFFRPCFRLNLGVCDGQGTILIAVNPLRKVEDPSMDDYMNRPLNPETPHPYAIAEVRALCLGVAGWA